MQKRMKWRSVAFDWNHARAFLVTAEEGSLTAAAQALGMAQPTLGRQVAALERELGVALFERVGRGLALTAGGLELLEHVRVMGEAAQRVALNASGQSQSIEGTVRISATEAYAAFIMPPIVAALRRAAPGVTIELVASNAISDLQRREADIAIRNVRPTHPDLVARRVRDDAAHLYATPGYLARFPEPRTAAQLSEADFIGFEDDSALIEHLAPHGFMLDAGNFRVASANHLVNWQMVKQGLGIGVMMAAVGDAEPLVTRALPDMAEMTFPVWLVAHREVNTSRRVRTVFDLLADALAKALTPVAKSRH